MKTESKQKPAPKERQPRADGSVAVRLRLPLAPEAREYLGNFLQEVRTALKQEAEVDAGARKISDHIQSLVSEVEALNKRFYAGDLSVLEELTSKRAQIGTIEAQKPAEKKRDAFQSWYGRMIAVNDFLRPYFDSAHADLVDDATALIAPFTRGQNKAVVLAKDLDACFAFSQFTRQQLLSAGNPKGAVLKLVSIVQNILEGKDFWTFQP